MTVFKTVTFWLNTKKTNKIKEYKRENCGFQCGCPKCTECTEKKKRSFCRQRVLKCVLFFFFSEKYVILILTRAQILYVQKKIKAEQNGIPVQFKISGFAPTIY